jgi:hypothetical protein
MKGKAFTDMMKAMCIGMVRNERQLIEINGTLCLAQQVSFGRKDGTELEDMPIPKNEEQLYQRVSDMYAETQSLKKTAKLLSLSEERTRRILLTIKKYTCDIHEKLMQALRDGKSLDEAAEFAGVGRNRVHAYLPYRFK